MTKGRLTIQCVGQSLRGVPKVSQARSLLKFDGSYCPIVEVSSKAWRLRPVDPAEHIERIGLLHSGAISIDAFRTPNASCPLDVRTKAP